MHTQQAHANAAERELQEVRDALQQAEQEWDEARAGHQQVPTGSFQALPDPGTQKFHQELAATKQELEQLCSRMSAPSPAVDVAKLQSQLQEAQITLAAQRATMPESILQTRVAIFEHQCQKAQGHIQELLDEGQALQDRYRELQNQNAMQEVQLNGQLKVAEMEIEGLKKRVEMKSEFSKKWAGEITHLIGEVLRFQSEKDELTEVLQGLKKAPLPAKQPRQPALPL